MKEKLLEALTQWQEKKNFPISDDDLGEIIEIAYGIVQSKINLTASERDKEIVEAVEAERERILKLAEDVEVETSFGYDPVTLRMIDVRKIKSNID